MKKSYNRKITLIIVLILIIPVILTGCWSNVDITDIAIATAIGFDMTEEGNVEFTVQLVKPGVIKAKAQGSQEDTVWIHTGRGDTVLSAIRNLLTTINRKTFFSHVQLMVISEEIARRGVMDILDLFERDKETQKLADLIVSRGLTAREVLMAHSELENIPSIHIKAIIENFSDVAKLKKINLMEIIQCLSCPGYSPAMGVIKIDPEVSDIEQKDKFSREKSNRIEIKDLSVEGTAVFEKDRLVGWLDAFETRGFLFAIDKVKSGIINVPNPLQENKKVAFEIVKSSGKMDVKLKDGDDLQLIIEVEVTGKMASQQGRGNLTTPDMIKKLEKEVARVIKKNIQSAVTKAQWEYRSDIFGFSKKLWKNHNQYWKKIEENWDGIFSTCPVKIKVKSKIVSSSLTREPTTPN